MTLIDVENTTEPLELEKFTLLAKDEYPCCIIGFQLKNSYDQERIQIKAKYQANDVLHFLPTAKITPVCFRGIKLKLKARFKGLVSSLSKLNTSLNEDINLDKYKKIISDYNLTCEECYLYLRRGVYPIDGKCLSQISEYKHTLEELYTDAFNMKDVPLFQAYSSFTIFILCDETIF